MENTRLRLSRLINQEKALHSSLNKSQVHQIETKLFKNNENYEEPISPSNNFRDTRKRLSRNLAKEEILHNSTSSIVKGNGSPRRLFKRVAFTSDSSSKLTPRKSRSLSPVRTTPSKSKRNSLYSSLNNKYSEMEDTNDFQSLFGLDLNEIQECDFRVNSRLNGLKDIKSFESLSPFLNPMPDFLKYFGISFLQFFHLNNEYQFEYHIRGNSFRIDDEIASLIQKYYNESLSIRPTSNKSLLFNSQTIYSWDKESSDFDLIKDVLYSIDIDDKASDSDKVAAIHVMYACDRNNILIGILLAVELHSNSVPFSNLKVPREPELLKLKRLFLTQLFQKIGIEVSNQVNWIRDEEEKDKILDDQRATLYISSSSKKLLKLNNFLFDPSDSPSTLEVLSSQITEAIRIDHGSDVWILFKSLDSINPTNEEKSYSLFTTYNTRQIDESMESIRVNLTPILENSIMSSIMQATPFEIRDSSIITSIKQWDNSFPPKSNLTMGSSSNKNKDCEGMIAIHFELVLSGIDSSAEVLSPGRLSCILLVSFRDDSLKTLLFNQLSSVSKLVQSYFQSRLETWKKDIQEKFFEFSRSIHDITSSGLSKFDPTTLTTETTDEIGVMISVMNRTNSSLAYESFGVRKSIIAISDHFIHADNQASFSASNAHSLSFFTSNGVDLKGFGTPSLNLVESKWLQELYEGKIVYFNSYMNTRSQTLCRHEDKNGSLSGFSNHFGASSNAIWGAGQSQQQSLEKFVLSIDERIDNCVLVPLRTSYGLGILILIDKLQSSERNSTVSDFSALYLEQLIYSNICNDLITCLNQVKAQSLWLRRARQEFQQTRLGQYQLDQVLELDNRRYSKKFVKSCFQEWKLWLLGKKLCVQEKYADFLEESGRLGKFLTISALNEEFFSLFERYFGQIFPQFTFSIRFGELLNADTLSAIEEPNPFEGQLSSNFKESTHAHYLIQYFPTPTPFSESTSSQPNPPRIVVAQIALFKNALDTQDSFERKLRRSEVHIKKICRSTGEVYGRLRSDLERKKAIHDFENKYIPFMTEVVPYLMTTPHSDPERFHTILTCTLSCLKSSIPSEAIVLRIKKDVISSSASSPEDGYAVFSSEEEQYVSIPSLEFYNAFIRTQEDLAVNDSKRAISFSLIDSKSKTSCAEINFFGLDPKEAQVSALNKKMARSFSFYLSFLINNLLHLKLSNSAVNVKHHEVNKLENTIHDLQKEIIQVESRINYCSQKNVFLVSVLDALLCISQCNSLRELANAVFQEFPKLIPGFTPILLLNQYEKGDSEYNSDCFRVISPKIEHQQSLIFDNEIVNNSSVLTRDQIQPIPSIFELAAVSASMQGKLPLRHSSNNTIFGVILFFKNPEDILLHAEYKENSMATAMEHPLNSSPRLPSSHEDNFTILREYSNTLSRGISLQIAQTLLKLKDLDSILELKKHSQQLENVLFDKDQVENNLSNLLSIKQSLELQRDNLLEEVADLKLKLEEIDNIKSRSELMSSRLNEKIEDLESELEQKISEAGETSSSRESIINMINSFSQDSRSTPEHIISWLKEVSDSLNVKLQIVSHNENGFLSGGEGINGATSAAAEAIRSGQIVEFVSSYTVEDKNSLRESKKPLRGSQITLFSRDRSYESALQEGIRQSKKNSQGQLEFVTVLCVPNNCISSSDINKHACYMFIKDSYDEQDKYQTFTKDLLVCAAHLSSRILLKPPEKVRVEDYLKLEKSLDLDGQKLNTMLRCFEFGVSLFTQNFASKNEIIQTLESEIPLLLLHQGVDPAIDIEITTFLRPTIASNSFANDNRYGSLRYEEMNHLHQVIKTGRILSHGNILWIPTFNHSKDIVFIARIERKFKFSSQSTDGHAETPYEVSYTNPDKLSAPSSPHLSQLFFNDFEEKVISYLMSFSTPLFDKLDVVSDAYHSVQQASEALLTLQTVKENVEEKFSMEISSKLELLDTLKASLELLQTGNSMNYNLGFLLSSLKNSITSISSSIECSIVFPFTDDTSKIFPEDTKLLFKDDIRLAYDPKYQAFFAFEDESPHAVRVHFEDQDKEILALHSNRYIFSHMESEINETVRSQSFAIPSWAIRRHVSKATKDLDQDYSDRAHYLIIPFKMPNGELAVSTIWRHSAPYSNADKDCIHFLLKVFSHCISIKRDNRGLSELNRLLDDLNQEAQNLRAIESIYKKFVPDITIIDKLLHPFDPTQAFSLWIQDSPGTPKDSLIHQSIHDLLVYYLGSMTNMEVLNASGTHREFSTHEFHLMKEMHKIEVPGHFGSIKGWVELEDNSGLDELVRGVDSLAKQNMHHLSGKSSPIFLIFHYETYPKSYFKLSVDKMSLFHLKLLLNLMANYMDGFIHWSQNSQRQHLEFELKSEGYFQEKEKLLGSLAESSQQIEQLKLDFSKSQEEFKEKAKLVYEDKKEKFKLIEHFMTGAMSIHDEISTELFEPTIFDSEDSNITTTKYELLQEKFVANLNTLLSIVQFQAFSHKILPTESYSARQETTHTQIHFGNVWISRKTHLQLADGIREAINSSRPSRSPAPPILLVVAYENSPLYHDLLKLSNSDASQKKINVKLIKSSDLSNELMNFTVISPMTHHSSQPSIDIHGTNLLIIQPFGSTAKAKQGAKSLSSGTTVPTKVILQNLSFLLNHFYSFQWTYQSHEEHHDQRQSFHEELKQLKASNLRLTCDLSRQDERAPRVAFNALKLNYLHEKAKNKVELETTLTTTKAQLKYLEQLSADMTEVVKGLNGSSQSIIGGVKSLWSRACSTLISLLSSHVKLKKSGLIIKDPEKNTFSELSIREVSTPIPTRTLSFDDDLGSPNYSTGIIESHSLESLGIQVEKLIQDIMNGSAQAQRIYKLSRPKLGFALETSTHHSQEENLWLIPVKNAHSVFGLLRVTLELPREASSTPDGSSSRRLADNKFTTLDLSASPSSPSMGVDLDDFKKVHELSQNAVINFAEVFSPLLHSALSIDQIKAEQSEQQSMKNHQISKFQETHELLKSDMLYYKAKVDLFSNIVFAITEALQQEPRHSDPLSDVCASLCRRLEEKLSSVLSPHIIEINIDIDALQPPNTESNQQKESASLSSSRFEMKQRPDSSNLVHSENFYDSNNNLFGQLKILFQENSDHPGFESTVLFCIQSVSKMLGKCLLSYAHENIAVHQVKTAVDSLQELERNYYNESLENVKMKQKESDLGALNNFYRGLADIINHCLVYSEKFHSSLFTNYSGDIEPISSSEHLHELIKSVEIKLPELIGIPSLFMFGLLEKTELVTQGQFNNQNWPNNSVNTTEFMAEKSMIWIRPQLDKADESLYSYSWKDVLAQSEDISTNLAVSSMKKRQKSSYELGIRLGSHHNDTEDSDETSLKFKFMSFPLVDSKSEEAIGVMQCIVDVSHGVYDIESLCEDISGSLSLTLTNWLLAKEFTLKLKSIEEDLLIIESQKNESFMLKETWQQRAQSWKGLAQMASHLFVGCISADKFSDLISSDAIINSIVGTGLEISLKHSSVNRLLDSRGFDHKICAQVMIPIEEEPQDMVVDISCTRESLPTHGQEGIVMVASELVEIASDIIRSSHLFFKSRRLQLSENQKETRASSNVIDQLNHNLQKLQDKLDATCHEKKELANVLKTVKKSASKFQSFAKSSLNKLIFPSIQEVSKLIQHKALRALDHGQVGAVASEYDRKTQIRNLVLDDSVWSEFLSSTDKFIRRFMESSDFHISVLVRAPLSESFSEETKSSSNLPLPTAKEEATSYPHNMLKLRIFDLYQSDPNKICTVLTNHNRFLFKKKGDDSEYIAPPLSIISKCFEQGGIHEQHKDELTTVDLTGIHQTFYNQLISNVNKLDLHLICMPIGLPNVNDPALLRLVYVTEKETDRVLGENKDFLLSLLQPSLEIFCSISQSLVLSAAIQSRTIIEERSVAKQKEEQKVSENTQSILSRWKRLYKVICREATIFLDPPVIGPGGTAPRASHPASLTPLAASQDSCLKALSMIRTTLRSEGQALILKDTSDSSSYQIIYTGDALQWPGIEQGAFGIVSSSNNLSPKSSIVEYVLNNRKSHNVANAPIDPYYNSYIDGICSLETPILVSPLRGRGGTVVGVVIAAKGRNATPFSSEDTTCLEIISSLGALSLYWCQGMGSLHHKLNKYVNKMDNLEKTVKKLTSNLD